MPLSDWSQGLGQLQLQPWPCTSSPSSTLAHPELQPKLGQQTHCPLYPSATLTHSKSHRRLAQTPSSSLPAALAQFESCCTLGQDEYHVLTLALRCLRGPRTIQKH